MQKGNDMKNIHALLKEIGIEIPEEKKADFDKALLENYKTVAEVEKITTARDNFKEQLETAKTQLKEFEGVDVKDLQGKIATLTSDLETKDKEYQNKIADMEFTSVIDSAISKSGAKNAKAVKALLDLDTLKTSKNQAEDITKALDEIKKDNDYMFTSDEPFKNPVYKTDTNNGKGDPMEAMRSAMGLSTEKK